MSSFLARFSIVETWAQKIFLSRKSRNKKSYYFAWCVFYTFYTFWELLEVFLVCLFMVPTIFTCVKCQQGWATMIGMTLWNREVLATNSTLACRQESFTVDTTKIKPFSTQMLVLHTYRVSQSRLFFSKAHCSY